MRKRSFSIGALSDIGYVKKTNQDRILIKVGEEQFGEFGIFVVADGMGGLTAGDKASGIVIDEFKKWWHNELSLILKNDKKNNIDIINKELNKLIFNINKKVITFGKSINCRVGTTLSMLFIYRNKYIIKHIGDSRIYKINKAVNRLTEDQSWIANQIRQGLVDEADAVNHPKRHILLQCIGVKESINIFDKKEELFEEDIFLLCSDGFYNLLVKSEIIEIVGKNKKNEEDIQSKVEKLMAKVKARGALDNASVILIYQNYDDEKKGVWERLKDLIS